MEIKDINILLENYKNKDFKNNLKEKLINELIEYLEILEYKKLKISSIQRIELNNRLKFLKSKIETKMRLVEGD